MNPNTATRHGWAVTVVGHPTPSPFPLVAGGLTREASMAHRVRLTEQEAKDRLTRRWHEQATMFPTMLRDIPLNLYIQVNFAHVLRHGLLAAYATTAVPTPKRALLVTYVCPRDRTDLRPVALSEDTWGCENCHETWYLPANGGERI